jgi:quercetin dioxygenase-like cupin family protein
MPRKLIALRAPVLSVLGALITLMVSFWLGKEAGAREAEVRLRTLLVSSTTIVNEPITYPPGVAKVTATVLTLQPGEETGLHTHPVPAFGYILDGELTVAYDGQGSRTYKAGDVVLESMSIAHNGRNSGARPMRILAVFMGSKDLPLSVPVTASAPGSK